MALPGFTAEITLGQSHNHYRLGPTTNQRDGALYPAAAMPHSRFGWPWQAKCWQECVSSNEYCHLDPYCYSNCDCACYGRPGENCWFM